MPVTRLLHATDVHGSAKVFKKLIRAVDFYKVNVLNLGGDMTGKMVIPIVEHLDGSYSAEFLGTPKFLRTKEELDKLEELILDNGFYPYRANEQEVEELRADPAKLDKLFKRLMFDTVEKWFTMAEEKLKSCGIKLYVTGGNDDPFDIDKALKGFECIINAEGIVVEIDNHHEMISTGYSNLTPWKTPRELTEDQLAKKIDAMASQIRNMSNAIFNIHIPPKDSNLDTCPLLDTTQYPPKPAMKGGQPVFFGAGSTAVRQAIEKYQPLMGLHGHIHESRGFQKIGRTLCVNPGSEYGEGILRSVILTLDEKGIKSYQFVSG